MKKIAILIAGLVASSFLVSCNNSEDTSSEAPGTIDVYEGQVVTDDNFTYTMNSYSYHEYDDHRLEMDFGFQVTNRNSESTTFTVKDAKAYGNDTLLVEAVLKSFDYEDKSKNEVFSSIELTINKGESQSFDMILVVQDGNPSAKFKIGFVFNDIDINIYSYDEGYEPKHFTYVHNPSLYSKVLVDVDKDINAVYGYKPNTTGSLKQYVDYAWDDPNEVAKYKQDRIKYIEENDQIIKNLETSMRAEGKSIEEIARACGKQRNQNRLDQYKDDPEGLAKLKERNLEKYGHEDGPTPEQLYDQYGSWEVVLEKCYSTNAGMDAACGVYDMYFNMYVSLPY